MSKFEDPHFQIRLALWTAIVIILFSMIRQIAGILGLGWMEGHYDPWAVVDIVLFAFLTYGLYRKNLLSAALLLVYWVISRLYNAIVLDLKLSGFAVTAAIMFGLGIRGILMHRKMSKKSDP